MVQESRDRYGEGGREGSRKKHKIFYKMTDRRKDRQRRINEGKKRKEGFGRSTEKEGEGIMRKKVTWWEK